MLLRLFMSKCHSVGNNISRLKCHPITKIWVCIALSSNEGLEESILECRLARAFAALQSFFKYVCR